MKAGLILYVGLLCTCIAPSQQSPPNSGQEPDVILAAANGDLDRLESLFKSDKSLKNVNHRDTALWTPLFHAVDQNNERMVQMTIDYGAEIDPRDRKHGFTPLHLAIFKNFNKIARILITYNANVSSVSTSGDSILHTASEKADAETINLLIKNGADVNSLNAAKQTPLHRSASTGGAAAAKALIEANASISQVDQNNLTPLNLAIMHKNSPDMVELLIDKGANVNYLRESDGMSPLTCLAATDGADPEHAKLLILHGADVNHVDREGKTPLLIAAGVGNLGVMEVLIKAGADVNAKDKDLNTPLHIAAAGSKDVFYYITKLLVDNDADIYAENANEDVPLDVATSNKIWRFLEDKRTWYGWLQSIW